MWNRRKECRGRDLKMGLVWRIGRSRERDPVQGRFQDEREAGRLGGKKGRKRWNPRDQMVQLITERCRGREQRTRGTAEVDRLGVTPFRLTREKGADVVPSASTTRIEYRSDGLPRVIGLYVRTVTDLRQGERTACDSLD